MSGSLQKNFRLAPRFWRSGFHSFAKWLAKKLAAHDLIARAQFEKRKVVEKRFALDDFDESERLGAGREFVKTALVNHKIGAFANLCSIRSPKTQQRKRARENGGARVASVKCMKTSLGAAVVRQTFLGAFLVLLSLPFLWILHRGLGLGNPPISGILLLGGAVILAFAGAGAIGASVGAARGNALVAGVLSLLLGGIISAGAAPFYGSIILDDLTREGAGMVWAERDRITGGASNALTSRAGETFDAARQGRLRDQLSKLQSEAQSAASSQTRDSALQKAKGVAGELASLGKQKGVDLLKSGVARASAFALLFWTILGAPLAGIFEAKRARRY